MVTTYDPHTFYESTIAAGAILFGFCGTFLAFKIQREASYYRQPAVSFEQGKARDVLVDLSHFSSAFLLLVLGTIFAAVFGFVLPLFALAGSTWISANPAVVVGGLVAALILIGAYFVTELVHYRIVSNKLLHDPAEWGSESGIVIGGVVLALIAAVAAYMLTRGTS